MSKGSKKNMHAINGTNLKSLKEFITQENKFISNLIDKLPIPSHAEDEESDNDGELKKPGLLESSINGVGPKKGNRARSLEELAQKLKILQASNKKSTYKNKLAKKGLKNKLKKKKKHEERSLRKKLARAQKAGDLKMTIPDSVKKTVKPVKPVFNSEGKLVFSKFDFSEIGKQANDKKEERDPKKILKQMEKQKEKMLKLENSGETEKVQEIKEKQAWMLALKKSQGVKVKDDAELLKKTVKRTEQRKKQSSKKWKSREDNVKKQQEDRQKKRQQSIQQRKDKNKQTKLKKSIKKGRVMPGF